MSGAVSALTGGLVGGSSAPSITYSGADDSAAVAAAEEAERKRAALAAGRKSTILTGGQGVSGGLGTKSKLGD